MDKLEGFAELLLIWYDAGHRALPWRETHDPYAIWVSEIMLQQTRVETVVGYYQRFLERFPTARALAEAPEQELLKAWEGLGYYSRARNLQRAAQQLVAERGGALPDTAAELERLPGIGAYTAGAVASIAFGRRTAAVDGNVERVVSRVAGIREEVTVPSVRRALRAQAEALVPERRCGDFNNAMMELGARVCVPGVPDCTVCPVSALCDAHAAGDADALPVKRRARAQRTERRGVAILRCGDRVLVQRRVGERLLQGLWQFPAVADVYRGRELLRALAKRGVRAAWVREAGEAKHVFTHIIWEMKLHLLTVRKEIDAALSDSRWVDAAGLEELPLPTAMRAAKKAALSWLAEDGGKG